MSRSRIRADVAFLRTQVFLIRNHQIRSHINCSRRMGRVEHRDIMPFRPQILLQEVSIAISRRVQMYADRPSVRRRAPVEIRWPRCRVTVAVVTTTRVTSDGIVAKKNANECVKAIGNAPRTNEIKVLSVEREARIGGRRRSGNVDEQRHAMPFKCRKLHSICKWFGHIH